MGWLSSAVSAGAGYLPAQVADVLAQGRAFAAARLPHTGYRAAAAITHVRAPRLLVATAQGVLYVYALDAAEGGECALLRQHQFLEGPASTRPLEAAALSTSNSYAGALRGRDPLRMTESERAGELGAALEAGPARGPFDLRDPKHFPPMRSEPAAR